MPLVIGKTPVMVRQSAGLVWFRAPRSMQNTVMLGAVLFLLFFILIAPASRALLGQWLSQAGTWTAAWAPFSYIILLLLLAAPFVSFFLMHHWPKTPEPENPLARYKHEDVEMD